MQFQAALAGGTIARTPHFALHRLSLQPPDAVPACVAAIPAKPLFEGCSVWMGAMVPKRWAKRAVTRNAIKRQIYNAGVFALSAQETVFGFAAHVVRLRAGFDKSAFPSATSDVLKAAVRQELKQLFAKAAQAAQQTSRAGTSASHDKALTKT